MFKKFCKWWDLMNMHLQRNSSAANYARKIRYGYRFANNIDLKVARKIEYDHKFANSIAPIYARKIRYGHQFANIITPKYAGKIKYETSFQASCDIPFIVGNLGIIWRLRMLTINCKVIFMRSQLEYCIFHTIPRPLLARVESRLFTPCWY